MPSVATGIRAPAAAWSVWQQTDVLWTARLGLRVVSACGRDGTAAQASNGVTRPHKSLKAMLS